MLLIKPRILGLHTYFLYAVVPLFMVSDKKKVIWHLSELIPVLGRLSDILGRKGAMLLALSLFGVLPDLECTEHGMN